MTFIDAVNSCMRQYVHFEGRARRSEYWYFQLFLTLLHILTVVICSQLMPMERVSFYTNVVSVIFLMPILTVSVRRLHDVGKSGWFVLLPFTLIGAIPFLYWMVKASDDGRNAYGDPVA